MKSIKKLLVSISCIALVLVFSIGSANALSIYGQSKTSRTLAPGVVYDKIKLNTSRGPQQVRLFKVDISRAAVSVDTIFDHTGLVKKHDTKEHAVMNKVIAAINGSLQDPNNHEGGQYHPRHLMQHEGKIATIKDVNESFSAFDIKTVGEEPGISEWTAEITVTSGTKTANVGAFNKFSDANYDDLTIIDKQFRSESFGAIYSNMVEVVVENGLVKQIRRNGKPRVKIPANGFVISTRSSGRSMGFIDSLNIGDSISYNIATTPNWLNYTMGIYTDAKVLKDGTIDTSFNNDTSPGAGTPMERTGMGSSENGNIVYLMTCDQISGWSAGITYSEVGQLLKYFGAHNGINLDGGGSTMSVAKISGSYQTLNIPSDGAPRPVVNAIGVFTGPKDYPTLNNIQLSVNDSNIFVNGQRAITITGYDSQSNKVKIDDKDIIWSVSGVEGTFFGGNKFRGVTTGTGTIKASVGTVTGSIQVQVLADPVSLTLSPATLDIAVGNTKKFTLTGEDSLGNIARIEGPDVNWKVINGIGTISSTGLFKAKSVGTGAVRGSFGDLTVSSPVTVTN